MHTTCVAQTVTGRSKAHTLYYQMITKGRKEGEKAVPLGTAMAQWRALSDAAKAVRTRTIRSAINIQSAVRCRRRGVQGRVLQGQGRCVACGVQSSVNRAAYLTTLDTTLSKEDAALIKTYNSLVSLRTVPEEMRAGSLYRKYRVRGCQSQHHITRARAARTAASSTCP